MPESTTDALIETGATTDAVDDLDPDARARVERARTVAHLLDDAVRVPGTDFRVGIDPVLGIAPVSGDALAVVGSLYIVYQGMEAGVSRNVVGRMLLSILAEFVVGSIPVLGTLIDAGWRINLSNVDRIEADLRE